MKYKPFLFAHLQNNNKKRFEFYAPWYFLFHHCTEKNDILLDPITQDCSSSICGQTHKIDMLIEQLNLKNKNEFFYIKSTIKKYSLP